MIGHRSRFRENDDLPLRRGPVVKNRHFLIRARSSRVKLCAVMIRIAILGMTLKKTVKFRDIVEPRYVTRGQGTG